MSISVQSHQLSQSQNSSTVAECCGTSHRVVLFALSPDDRRRFLPAADLSDIPGVKSVWVDPSKLTPEEWQNFLFEHEPEILVTGWQTPSIPEAFACEPGLALRYVCHLAGGVRGLVSRSLIEKGVLVTNWGTAISHTIAEHAMLLTLAALRNLAVWNSYLDMPENRVVDLRTQSLRGKRVGVHGFGGVARELVQMLQAFRADVAAYSYGVPKALFEEYQVKRCESLEELFSGRDIIIECEALTPQSRGSVSESLLRRLPDDAVFVNVGRGLIVDEAALVRMCSEGKLRVAADVFQVEPLSGDSPWRKLPFAILSPHIAGPTLNAFALCGEAAIRNVRSYFQEGRVDGVITPAVYDRLA